MNKVIAFLFAILIAFSFECSAQNLFPNPDFEQYTALPTTYSGINTGDCVGWNCIAGSPDYYNSSFYGSGNPAGLPSSGTGVVGMWGLPNNLFCNGALQTESIVGTLLAPLEKCRRYRVTFDLRLQQVGSTSTPGYGPGCLDFGFYFFNGADPNLCGNSCGCWGSVTPQVAVSEDQVPLSNYRTFTFEFVASANLSKVAIGPFCTDTMFSASCYDTPSNYGSFAMYFNLDNMSIVKVDDIDLMMTDTSICEGESITFTGTSLDTVLNWNWSIPGAVQTYVSGDSVIYLFPGAGDYDLSVVTQTACGSGSGFYPGAISVHPLYDDVEIDSSLLTCTSMIYTIPGNHSTLNYLWSDSIAGSTRYFPSPGIYTVQVTDQYGCHASDDTIDVKLVDSFSVFPNPTNTAWTSDYAISTPNHLTLYDSEGRLILSESDVPKIEIVAADYRLASGMYYLDVSISDCTKTIKLILVR